MSDLEQLLRLCWHPVCTLAELSAAGPTGRGPLAVTLLGQRLAIAEPEPGRVIALADRCVHRSASLSVGQVDDGGIRCAYHGWRYDSTGRCVDIPAMPGATIPSRACVASYAVRVAYDLVWVCLDPAADLPIPVCTPFGDPALRVLPGEPYTWPVAAGRRVENFVDLGHFAFVHDGSLGSRDEPVPPIPVIGRADGELRFTYEPPDLTVQPTALFGFSSYRMAMPCTVDIEFRLANGARRVLWMTASPVSMRECRTFWFVARSDAWHESDAEHLAFQAQILREDEPVVASQDPPEMLLDAGDELSVKTDKVSIEYRTWLRELCAAAATGPDALRAALFAGAASTIPAAPGG